MSLIIFKNNLHNLRNEEISSQTGNKFHSNFNSSRTIKMIENRKTKLYAFLLFIFRFVKREEIWAILNNEMIFSDQGHLEICFNYTYNVYAQLA